MMNFRNCIYKDNDPVPPESDGLFTDGYDLQLASIIPNSNTGGYDAYLEVAVKNVGAVGISNKEHQTAQIFDLGQNAPNPFINETFVPITIKEKSDVKLELWDLNGKMVNTVYEQAGVLGSLNIRVNLADLGLSPGNYIYQLEAINSKGSFRLPKLMTIKL